MSKPTHISATQLLTQRGEILRRCYVDKEHFIVENHEMPIVAIIPFDEYQLSQTSRKQQKR